MNDYSVTAIMITCGRTACIGESIYSFMNQTYKNKKLIIFDTHPQNIKFNFELPDNIIYIKGNSHDFINLGEKYKHLIGMVDTELFCIWEDDDLWLPNHLEMLVNLYSLQNNDSNVPLAVGHKNHFSILGGVEKPIHTITINSNVCWCRYLFQNKNIDIKNLQEPFDCSFLKLFKLIYTDNALPTYIYRWDNGQCHMSGLYGQKSFEELYRTFEDSLSNVDISNKIIKLEWKHDYSTICNKHYGAS